MSFWQDIKDDFEKVKEDFEAQKETAGSVQNIVQEGIALGDTCIKNDQIVSFESGLLDEVNQAQDVIEFVFDDGTGITIRFTLFHPATMILVQANDKIEKGQLLIQIEHLKEAGIEVIAFNLKMIQELEQLRNKENAELPGEML